MKFATKLKLAFWGWLLLSAGGASADAPFLFAKREIHGSVIRLGLTAEHYLLVSLIDDMRSHVITISHVEKRHQTELKRWSNKSLLPRYGHFGEGPMMLRELRAEINGFTLIADYELGARVERYAFSFSLALCPNTSQICPPKLAVYRHERIEHNLILSGILLDYQRNYVRWLGGLVPPTFVSVIPPDFESLPNVFDFSPQLNLPKVHQ